jgi:hypothetical protein
MKDTVSGVLAGVFPKTLAPGNAATSTPEATCCGLFGFGVAAEAGPESTARGVMTVATPSAIPTASRVFLIRIMFLCTVL